MYLVYEITLTLDDLVLGSVDDLLYRSRDPSPRGSLRAMKSSISLCSLVSTRALLGSPGSTNTVVGLRPGNSFLFNDSIAIVFEHLGILFGLAKPLKLLSALDHNFPEFPMVVMDLEREVR